MLLLIAGLRTLKSLKKVIIDSGLTEMLDKVTFNGFSKEKEDVEKIVEGYKSIIMQLERLFWK